MERYMYRIPEWNGEFRNTGSEWEEYQNLIREFTFTEELRMPDSVTLLDRTRDMRVLLPLAGGQSFFLQGTTGEWTPLYDVDRVERTFTPTQQAILREDCEQARQKLDRVIARLGETAIVPTASGADMRRKVRNVFHIDLDAGPPDILTEAVHFVTLLSNFKTLRSVGFDHDPPFMFEPDSTRIDVAWVEGIVDPTVHIHPNHFYMDRDNLIITLIHERAHTVLKLPGHPGDMEIIDPADEATTMTRDQAMANAYCYEVLARALQRHN
jgi:hypothetical protein